VPRLPSNCPRQNGSTGCPPGSTMSLRT
jgi:hypothetical protein